MSFRRNVGRYLGFFGVCIGLLGASTLVAGEKQNGGDIVLPTMLAGQKIAHQIVKHYKERELTFEDIPQDLLDAEMDAQRISKWFKDQASTMADEIQKLKFEIVSDEDKANRKIRNLCATTGSKQGAVVYLNPTACREAQMNELSAAGICIGEAIHHIKDGRPELKQNVEDLFAAYIASSLIKREVEEAQRNRDGGRLLAAAIREGNSAAVNRLIADSVDVNSTVFDDDGDVSMMELAVRQVVSKLKKNPNILAVEIRNRLEILKSLYQNGSGLPSSAYNILDATEVWESEDRGAMRQQFLQYHNIIFWLLEISPEDDGDLFGKFAHYVFKHYDRPRINSLIDRLIEIQLKPNNSSTADTMLLSRLILNYQNNSDVKIARFKQIKEIGFDASDEEFTLILTNYLKSHFDSLEQDGFHVVDYLTGNGAHFDFSSKELSFAFTEDIVRRLNSEKISPQVLEVIDELILRGARPSVEVINIHLNLLAERLLDLDYRLYFHFQPGSGLYEIAYVRGQKLGIDLGAKSISMAEVGLVLESAYGKRYGIKSLRELSCRYDSRKDPKGLMSFFDAVHLAWVKLDNFNRYAPPSYRTENLSRRLENVAQLFLNLKRAGIKNKSVCRDMYLFNRNLGQEVSLNCYGPSLNVNPRLCDGLLKLRVVSFLETSFAYYGGGKGGRLSDSDVAAEMQSLCTMEL